jgi:hypothetical protein
MSDQPPPRVEMFGQILPDGTRSIPLDEYAKMQQWYATRNHFEDQFAPHPDSPLDHYGDLYDEGVPATCSETAMFVGAVLGGLIILGGLIFLAVATVGAVVRRLS